MEYVRYYINVVSVPFNFDVAHPCHVCYANPPLNLPVEMQLQPNNCLFGTPIPLNPDKLHRIISAMPCIPYLEHADSSSVVVRFVSVACSSICFFPDRIAKWCCEIRKVLRMFFDNQQASIFRSHSPILFCLLPYATLELRSCHVSYPLVTSSSPY